jgi:hypothetical protein
MHTRHPIFNPAHVQAGIAAQVHLIPSQINQFRRPKAMPERQQDHRGVALPIPIGLRGFDQSLDLGLGQVFAGA